MMMERCIRLFALLSLFALPAHAGTVSIGAGFGASEADFGDLRNQVDDLDDKSDTTKFFLTYRPIRALALEAFYLDLREYSAALGADSMMVETNGLGLALLGFVPLGDTVDLLIKGGVWQWDITAKETIGGATATYRKHDTSPVYGIGLHLRSATNPAPAVRFEYERFADVGENFGAFEGADVDVLSFSLIYNF